MQKRFQQGIVIILLAAVLAGCSGLAGEPAIVATFPPNPTRAVVPISLPQYAPDAALGAQVFAQNCTRCHGLNGKGDGELVQSGQVTGVPDFTNPQITQDFKPVDWFEIVTNGRLEKLMPPWGEKLSEAQRWAVTMYAYTLANSPQQIDQGQAVWSQTCSACHGDDGKGTSETHPLTGLLDKSTADLLKILDNGVPDNKHVFADELSQDDQLAVIAYTRTLTLSNADGSSAAVAGVPTTEAGANPQPATTEEAGSSNPQPATTEQPGSVLGVVSGTVTNRSSGGTVPADLTLNLHIISAQDASSPGDIVHTTVNPDGTYRFENVPIQAGQQYVVTTSYNDTAFNSQVVDGDLAVPQIDLPLDIYEIESDPGVIQIDGVLSMVQAQTDKLEVVQIFSFTNESDRIYLKQDGGTSTSVSVRLPSGAAFEDFSNGSYLISADGTQITDTQPIYPGNPHVMHIAFTLPYSGSASIAQQMDYPLNGTVEVMVGSDGLSVSGDGLNGLGARQLGDRTYQSFGGSLSRNAGDTLRYSVQGALSSAQSNAPATVNNISPLAYLLIGAGLLAIGAAFGFFMRERVTAGTATTAPAPISESLSPQSETLIQQIADLEARFNKGKITKTKYERQRAALKAELAAIMKDKGEL